MLRYLEQTREIFAKISSGGIDGDRPVRIVSFGSEGAFKRFRPRESAYAFFARRRDRDYIVFQELDGDKMYEVAIHEYSHLRSAELGLSLPVWLEEGLAELFSTMRPQGDVVLVGKPPQIVRARGVGSSPKLDEVLSADRLDEKLWKNNMKVVGLYARSWALAHLLVIHEDYREKFPEFITGIAAGESGEAMFEEVYSKDVRRVEKDMMAHVTGSTLPILTYTGEWSKWEDSLERRPVEDLEADLLIADLLLANGKAVQAREALQAILAQHPDNAEAHVTLARAWGPSEEALPHYERAVELGAQDARLYIDYARRLAASERSDATQVRTLLERAHELAPEEADPLLALAAIAEREGDLDAEKAALGQIKRVEGSQAYPYLMWRSEVMARAGNAASAGAFRTQAKQVAASLAEMQAIEADQGGSSAGDRWDALQKALADGDLGTAKTSLEQLRKQYPKLPEVVDAVADYYAKTGDAAASLDAKSFATNLRRLHVIQARKDDNDVLGRVSLLDALGAYQRSQAFQESLMELEPKSWVWPNNRAWSLAEDGVLLDRALVLAEKGVALSEENAASLDTLGWVQLKLGHLEDAAATFDKVLAKSPKSVIYKVHFAEVRLAQGEKAKARALLDEALALKPSEYWQGEIREALERAQ
ncbi:MAG: tetratricopeptide repeat protein [Bryobacterales bacterium]|nr:tetratricopeptide repeat protein [Bryobacterales bacterium]